MPINDLPQNIRDRYSCYEWRHSISILKYEFPEEYSDLLDVLSGFELKRSSIEMAGGRKSPIASYFDEFLEDRGWDEKKFDTSLIIDGIQHDVPTHKIDSYKNRVALDVEWNNKTPFFDRDLNNFRLLHDRGAISLAIIITRCTNLQDIFNGLGKGKSYGSSTTHINKLLPKINGGAAGGCPLLVFGISKAAYVDDLG
ncbi:restriction endonuclease [Lewinellaceae bacterium SD302]|nr:restriction endonuclease [Lewinellaceae bacterium SD302]